MLAALNAMIYSTLVTQAGARVLLHSVVFAPFSITTLFAW